MKPLRRCSRAAACLISNCSASEKPKWFHLSIWACIILYIAGPFIAWDEMILDLAPTLLITGRCMRSERIGTVAHVGQTGTLRLMRSSKLTTPSKALSARAIAKKRVAASAWRFKGSSAKIIVRLHIVRTVGIQRPNFLLLFHPLSSFLAIVSWFNKEEDSIHSILLADQNPNVLIPQAFAQCDIRAKSKMEL